MSLTQQPLYFSCTYINQSAFVSPSEKRLFVTDRKRHSARANSGRATNLASFEKYQEEMQIKERALQAEIARLKLVEEKYEEEMARKEKEVADTTLSS